jgi:pilus assembly protein Flp/PilA
VNEAGSRRLAIPRFVAAGRMRVLRSLGRATDGASSAEYALILAIIGVGIAAAAFFLGESIALSFQEYGNKLASS